jgi:hypothetical protein
LFASIDGFLIVVKCPIFLSPGDACILLKAPTCSLEELQRRKSGATSSVTCRRYIFDLFTPTFTFLFSRLNNHLQHLLLHHRHRHRHQTTTTTTAAVMMVAKEKAKTPTLHKSNLKKRLLFQRNH